MAYFPGNPNDPRYAPQTGNNVAGGGQGQPYFEAAGSTGAMTNGSLMNSAVNQAASTKGTPSGNPFTEASSIGASMMSALRKAPPPMKPGIPTSTFPTVPGGTGVQGAAPVGTGATIAPQQPVAPSGMQAAWLPTSAPTTSAQAELGQQTQNPDGSGEGPSEGEIPDPTGNIPPGGVTPPPANNQPPPILTQVAPGSEQRIWQNAQAWSKIPGFEWLTKNPEMIALWESQGGKESFSVWAGRNWELIAQKTGMSAQDQKNFGYFVRQEAYKRGAQDLRNQLYAKDPTKDNQWITPQLVAQYEDWRRANPTAKEDFFTWVGANKGDPTQLWPDPFAKYGQRGKRSADQIRSLATDVNADPSKFLNHPDFQDPASQQWIRAMMQRQKTSNAGGVGGPSIWGPGVFPPGGGGSGGPGGGGGGESTYNSGPTGGYVGGNQYLDTLKQALRASQGESLDKMMREYRHNAAIGGLENSGGYGVMAGDLMRGALLDQNKELNQLMFTGNENEQERLLKQALARITSADSRYAADAGANAAAAGAGASMYAADINKLLGLAGLDFDKWKFSQSLPLDYWKLLLDYFNSVGSLPGPGGPPSPTVPVVT